MSFRNRLIWFRGELIWICDMRKRNVIEVISIRDGLM